MNESVRMPARIAALVLCLLALVYYLQSRSEIRALKAQLRQSGEHISALTEANEEMSKSLAKLRTPHTPRLPAPAIASTTNANANTAELPRPNVLERIQSQTKKLTIAQVEAYLKTHGRSAPNLLAAFRSSGDAGLLREAMEKYPNDPKVAFEAATRPDATAEERSHWVDTLKQTAPDNSLGYYLAAADAFKAGKSEQAFTELASASSKSQFSDFTLERIQSDEDLYLASGYSLAEAKTIPSSELLLPQLSQLKDLGTQLTELASSYRNSGDEASANASLEMALQLAGRYVDRRTGEPEVSRLVGLAIEYNALQTMEPAAQYGTGSQTVKERMEEIDTERQDFKQLYNTAKDVLPQMSDQDWVSYIDHRRLFGEPAALRWAIDKFGK